MHRKTKQLLAYNNITYYRAGKLLKVRPYQIKKAVETGEGVDWLLCFLLTLQLSEYLIKKRICPECKKKNLYILYKDVVACRSCDYTVQLVKLKNR